MKMSRIDLEMIVGFAIMGFIIFALIAIMQEMSGIQGVLHHIITGR